MFSLKNNKRFYLRTNNSSLVINVAASLALEKQSPNIIWTMFQRVGR